jgi:glycosyltransferase involved in cell wall biosynthesis
MPQEKAMSEPLVSCIMPTCNRRAFVPRAIDCFLRQDYPDRELIVVDDGRDPVGDLVPADGRIRYVRLERRLSVGAKRNLACQQARGELIAHWDDDDWHAPGRLSYQVRALQEAKAEICGLRQMLFYDPAKGRAWLYSYPEGARLWLAGGSMLYSRDFWKRSPFPNLQVGEDARFLWSHSPQRALVLPDYSFYVAMIHPGNTSPKRTQDSYWREYPVEKVRQLIAPPPAERGGAQAPAKAPQPTWPRPSAASRPASKMPRITVSIPFFGCHAYVRQAVESILSQTHRNLVVVVSNDGDPRPPWASLADIDDPRLVRFDLQRNRGRFFADAVVLAATPDPFFSIQDADDWSDPDRLAALLELLRSQDADAALSASYHHQEQGGREVATRNDCFPGRGQSLAANFAHRANHQALFRAASLRRIGGCYSAFPVACDTLIMNLLLMTGEVAYLDEPLSHRRLRPGALTSSPATGFGSALRQEAARHMAELYERAFGFYQEHSSGRMGPRVLARQIRELCRASLPPGQPEAIETEAGRLRPILQAAGQRRRTLQPAAKIVPEPIASYPAEAEHAASPRPMVSCIMPTYNRRRFVSQAIRYFLRQDYAEKELIIVDDGSDPVADLVPQGLPIQYVRLPGRRSVGAKRNLACEAARGEIVMMWDDDDWYGARRISAQAAPLIFGKADLCGISEALMLELPTRQFWACTPALQARLFYEGVVSGTLAFWRQTWQRHGRFPDISVGEDASFHRLMMRNHLHQQKLPNAGLFIYTRHQSNTWRFQPGFYVDRRGWVRVEPPAFLLAEDRPFYGLPTAGEGGHPQGERVSCILATRGRPHFLRQAVRYFVGQTYPEKELIVVDDSPQPFQDPCISDGRIRYVHTTTPLSLGAKLNLGISLASGQIIQKIDDDDYYAPDFLATTIRTLLESGRRNAIAAFGSFLVYIAGTRSLKCSGRGWFAGGTLCFHRDLWKSHPFRDVNHAEDTYFLEDTSAFRLKIDRPDLYVLVRHGGDHAWTRLGNRDVTDYFRSCQDYPRPLSACLASEQDLAFYLGLAA